MANRKLTLALLLSTGLVAGGAIVWRSAMGPDESDVVRLLDPGYVAAGVCGRGNRHASAFQLMRLAMVPPAHAAEVADAPPPLWDGLGDLGYRVATGSEMAQRYFDQGFRLTWAFNHAEALRAFREAERQDPQCALCYWGEAFALGPNINAPMEDDAKAPALAALRKAQALAPQASEREQALIAALATRYSDAPDADRKALDQAYADAMAGLHARFPDDQNIAVLFADAVMNTTPWDYWEADKRTPKGRVGEAVSAIEGVLAANPDQAAAIHLYIHLTEASSTPERAERYADHLAALMPGAGHIVHMPSHTYYRVGRYLDALQANIAAVKVDEGYLAKVDVGKVHADGIYPYGYYPHNVHFELVSAQMAGDAATSLQASDKLAGLIPDAVAAKVGLVQPVKAAPYFAYVQFAEPAKALALPDPGDGFPYLQAMWHYARGAALTAEGDLDGARTEAARIAALNQSADFSLLKAWGVPAPDILQLARHVLEGRIAQAGGDLEGAIGEYRVAVQIQDSLPYMEPPYWYYPVRQSLGAALLMAGRADEAAKVFEAALLDAPNNGWALFGLMKAEDAAGDAAAAAATRRLFERAWAGGALPEVARL